MNGTTMNGTVGLERIHDLRREAEAWRRVRLARALLNPSPSTALPEQPAAARPRQAAHALAA
jgi:hypothetical protein